MAEKCTCDVPEEEEEQEEDDGGKEMSLEKYFCQHWRALTLRKYLMKIDVDDNTMAAWCSKKQSSSNLL